ncbi:MAG: hypothetical protein AAFW60_06015 [Pseudomonadota bacterium]
MTKKSFSLVQGTVFTALAALVTVTPLASADAQQRSVCGKRDAIMERLEAQYEEQPVAIGLDSKGGVMEMLAGPSGSWTIIRTNAKGLTCFMATGVAFEKMSPKALEPSA